LVFDPARQIQTQVLLGRKQLLSLAAKETLLAFLAIIIRKHIIIQLLLRRKARGREMAEIRSVSFPSLYPCLDCQ
jgi:hypothetical protein